MVKNDKSEFVKVDGAYRVSDIMVGGQPLDVSKTYTLASHNYMLKDAGDGYTMFGTKNVKLLNDGVMIDNQVLINYIVNNLGGVVGEQYAAPQGRITIKTAASDVPTNESDKVIAGRDTTVTEGDTYTVVAGDCLWNIAYKLYGTGTLYTKLAEANQARRSVHHLHRPDPDRSRQVKNCTIRKAARLGGFLLRFFAFYESYITTFPANFQVLSFPRRGCR